MSELIKLNQNTNSELSKLNYKHNSTLPVIINKSEKHSIGEENLHQFPITDFNKSFSFWYNAKNFLQFLTLLILTSTFVFLLLKLNSLEGNIKTEEKILKNITKEYILYEINKSKINEKHKEMEHYEKYKNYSNFYDNSAVDMKKKEFIELVIEIEMKISQRLSHKINSEIIRANKKILNKFKGIAICSIVKRENRYIKDWIEFYLKSGIDKIIIYDNNEKDGEKLEEVIDVYIKSNYVKLVNFRGEESAQSERAYKSCYIENQNDFSWMFFIGADEYLQINSGITLKQFLNQHKFDNCDAVSFYCEIYGDNNMTYYENNFFFVEKICNHHYVFLEFLEKRKGT